MSSDRAHVSERVGEGYPDESALDPQHEYYDAEFVRKTPTWFMVDVRAVEKLKREVTLTEIKTNSALSEMKLLKISRLSVVPVRKSEWDMVTAMSKKAKVD
ncbi:MAG: EVE domain-containing protein [Gemmatimonadaceae bacterium]